MYINFKELKFKNINSYGNSLSTFKLNKGLNCISGSNGQGKSTILDALCFCLFGVPFRKIKIDELINRDNKNSLYTEVSFNINQDNFVIKRGKKPNILKIEKNGKPLDLLSTQRLNQEEIDKILGLDITLFRQVISLAINYNKPFLSLKLPEKRDIMEIIFNIKVFSLMLKSVKEQNSNIKTEYEINNRTINILKKNLMESSSQLKQFKSKKENFDKDKEEQIEEINNKINNKDIELKQIEEQLKFNKESVKKYNKPLYTYQELLGKIDYRIKQNKKDIKFYTENDICPICKSNMDKTHRKIHINKKTDELDNLHKDKINIKKVCEILDNIYTLEQKLKYSKDELKTLNNNKEKIKEETFLIDIEEIENNVADKKEEYKDIYRKLQESNKEIISNNLIIKILGDEGIKTYFFSKLIPILNQKINEYLDLFNLPITINFDEYMNETIDTLKDRNVPYMSFSEGEKKRIDISILLSFIETTKLISNWGCNLMIFDELLDNSTDGEGLDKIFDSIRELIHRDANLCVYVISHRSLDIDFDGKYIIEKNNGFSKIKFEQSI